MMRAVLYEGDCKKKRLTFVEEIPSPMTLVTLLARTDHHFFLDFIFH